MDPSKRNAAALRERAANLTTALSHHYTQILADARESPHAKDYSASAQREEAIREGGLNLIKSTHDVSTLIRELQELWLFGGLDTLTDPADEEASRAKALGVAALIEKIANLPLAPESNTRSAAGGANGVATGAAPAEGASLRRENSNAGDTGADGGGSVVMKKEPEGE